MARPYITAAIRQKVAAQARNRCGYCLTAQAYTAMPLHIEHIIPVAAGGSSRTENLWLACPLCNGYKGTLIVCLRQTGRATVVALQLNNEYLVRARARWVAAGWHPPAS